MADSLPCVDCRTSLPSPMKFIVTSARVGGLSRLAVQITVFSRILARKTPLASAIGLLVEAKGI